MLLNKALTRETTLENLPLGGAARRQRGDPSAARRRGTSSPRYFVKLDKARAVSRVRSRDSSLNVTKRVLRRFYFAGKFGPKPKRE